MYILVYNAFPRHSGLIEGDISQSLLFSIAVEYVIRKGEENQEGLEMERTLQYHVCADGVTLLGKTETVKR
jgi:hypothetical protein